MVSVEADTTALSKERSRIFKKNFRKFVLGIFYIHRVIVTTCHEKNKD